VRPERIQLRRTKGWRKPEGAIVVARPSIFGNPYDWRVYGRQDAVRWYRKALIEGVLQPYAQPVDIEFRRMAEALETLRGHDLACWCPLAQPCHADVLLDLANR